MLPFLPLLLVLLLGCRHIVYCWRGTFRLYARSSRVGKIDIANRVEKKEVLDTASILQNTRKLMNLSSAKRAKDKDKLLLRDTLEDREILSFVRNGHLFLPQLLNPTIINDRLRPACLGFEKSRGSVLSAYRHKVKVQLDYKGNVDKLSLKECKALLKEAGIIDSNLIPFLQFFNLWRNDDDISKVALSKELGKIAAQLLGVNGVRLYHDTLFIKKSGNGPTLWHSDLNMAPFDTNDFITCWIPLQPVPSQSEGGSSLTFASRSHCDFALPYWSNPIETDLTGRYEIVDYPNFEVGDCTWHHGWTLHSAPPNTLDLDRYAYAISFIADGTYLLQEDGHIRRPDTEDYQSYEDWIEDVQWGNFADHKYLPLVFQEESNDDDTQEVDIQLD